jgi:hypothetical protein
MATAKKHSFLYNNSLSIVAFLLMFLSLAGQFIAGWHDKNDQMKEHAKQPLTAIEYAQSGHFIQATFENWESEFLQMGLFVWLTVFLRQKGSSQSEKIDEKEEADREPRPHKDAPWPVKKGGLWLKLYSYSLSIAFILLFICSFIIHFYGSLKNYNEEQLTKNLPPDSWNVYITSPHFWFESFQNWQSEFLAVASLALLTIWLRHKGSPQSKPVDAPCSETGE